MASWLEKFFEKTKEYHTAILFSICGIILVVVVVNICSLVSKSGEQKLWNEYQEVLNSNDLTQLQQFAQKHKNSSSGAMVSLQIGRNFLNEGQKSIQVNDKKSALENLAKAKEAFQHVASFSQTDFQQSAFMGLAKVAETLAMVEKADENLAESVTYYEKVVNLGGALAFNAKESLRVLKKPETKDLYVAFINRKSADSVNEDMLKIQSGIAEPDLDFVESVGLPEALPNIEVTEPAPAEEAAPAAEVTPAEETAPAAEVTPAEETAPAAKVTPAEETAPAAEVTPTVK